MTTPQPTNGFEAPAVTILALSNDTGVGWKSKSNQTDSMENQLAGTFLMDHCEEINQPDLEACITNDSYGLTEFLTSATFDVTSRGLNETEWIWDMDITAWGRYFTWSPNRLITPDFKDYIYMSALRNFRLYVFPHDINFFLVNVNPFGPTKSFWEFDGSTEPNHYQQIYLVRHKKLNLDHRPCIEDEDYNFGKCVKESLVRQVGCKRPWDKGNEQEICTTREQFKQFDLLYHKLMLIEVKEIEGSPGCLKPCMYNEYKIVNSVPKKALSITGVPDGQIAIGLWVVSQYTEYEEEVLLFVLFIFIHIHIHSKHLSLSCNAILINRCSSTRSPLCWLSLEAVLDFSLDFPSSQFLMG